MKTKGVKSLRIYLLEFIFLEEDFKDALRLKVLIKSW